MLNNYAELLQGRTLCNNRYKLQINVDDVGMIDLFVQITRVMHLTDKKKLYLHLIDIYVLLRKTKSTAMWKIKSTMLSIVSCQVSINRSSTLFCVSRRKADVMLGSGVWQSGCLKIRMSVHVQEDNVSNKKIQFV